VDAQKYSIGYTAKKVGLPQSVLRYWESVFEQFNPEKTQGGTRRYSDEDISLILKIKNLLYERKFTIKGAQAYLKEETGIIDKEWQQYIISELTDIIATLDSKGEP